MSRRARKAGERCCARGRVLCSRNFPEHPWALEATLGARPFGPNEVAWLEFALAALGETPLRGAEKLDVVVTLIGHVRHLVQQAGPSDSERAFLDAMRALTEGHAASFPALTAVLDEPTPKHSEGAALDYGLDCILDGVEARIARDKARRKPR